MKILELINSINWGMVSLAFAILAGVVGAIIKYKLDMNILQIELKNHAKEIKQVKQSQVDRKKWAEDIVAREKAASEKRFQALEDNNSLQHEKILDKFDQLLEKLNNFMVYVEKKIK